MCYFVHITVKIGMKIIQCSKGIGQYTWFNANTKPVEAMFRLSANIVKNNSTGQPHRAGLPAGPRLSVMCVATVHLDHSPLSGCHLTDNRTEAQRGQITWLRQLSVTGGEMRFESRTLSAKALDFNYKSETNTSSHDLEK